VGRRLAGARASILDLGTVASPLEVSEAVTLASVQALVDIRHSFVGDLEIGLRSPSGTTVGLLDRPGYPAGQIGCGDQNLAVLFTDASTFDPEDHCAGTRPWLSGEARPVTPLAAFAGEDARGTWQLAVTDHEFGDEGEIESWTLITDPPLPGLCQPCSGCPGQVILPNRLFLTRGAGDTVVLHDLVPQSPCATGVQVRLAPTARPASGAGSFPTDPPFADRTAEDQDPGPDFRHPAPAGDAYYQVVEALPDGSAGPSGCYGY
jgi:hypothetical protein